MSKQKIPKAPPTKPMKMAPRPTNRSAAQLVVLDGEDALAFAYLRDELVQTYKPEGPVATFFLDQAVTLMWRLRRVARFELGMLTWISEKQHRRHDGKGLVLGNVFLPSDTRALLPRGTGTKRSHKQDLQVLGRTLEVVLETSDPLGKIGRYESHLMKQLAHAIQRLESCARSSSTDAVSSCNLDKQ